MGFHALLLGIPFLLIIKSAVKISLQKVLLKKFGISLMLIMILSPKLFASFEVNENCIAAYNKIIALRIEEGKTLLNNEKVINPKNDIPYFLENYIDFLTLFISEDKKNFDKLKDNMDKRLERMERGENNSPFYLYTQAEIYLQWAIVKIKFKEYVSAAFDLQKALNLLTYNNERYPLFKANYLGLGFLHAIAGAVPENYKWVAKLVGVKGTISQGVGELKELLNFVNNSEYKYLHDEVLFILALVEWNLQKDEEEAQKLLQNPDFSLSTNPFLLLAKATIAMKTNHNDDAIQLLVNRTIDNESYPFYYLDFMTGMAKLNRLDADAGIYFSNYLTNFKGQNYIKTAWQKLAWISIMNNDTIKYKEYIKQCIASGDDNVDEDKDALKEATNGEIPNIILLKARLLCDGGYYQKSISVIAGMKVTDFTRLKDQLEVTYRMGRIFHRTNELDKALDYYEQTLKNGVRFTYYFAANSALQMASIYEKLGNREKALHYYNTCLAMRNHDYQNSIDQKAEAGLDRLGGK